MRFILSVCCLSLVLPLAISQHISLGSTINTNYTEGHPLLSPDGQTLYYTRSGDPKNMGIEDFADVWITNKQADNTWSRPINAASPLNTMHNDAVLSVGPAAAWLMHFSHGNTLGPTVIYQDGRSWHRSDHLKVDGLEDWRIVNTCFLDIQGQILLLVMKNEAGNLDLFYAQPLGKDHWSLPAPLPLNSKFDEHHPILAADGETLYFASNRPGGQGGFDWWISRKGNTWNEWSKPENLGPSFNTPAADTLMTLSASGEETIVGKLNENGNVDLYQIDLPPAFKPKPIRLILGECISEQSLPPTTLLYQREFDEPVFQQVEIGSSGTFCLVMPLQETVYVSAESADFFAQSVFVGQEEDQLFLVDEDPSISNAWAKLNTAYFERDERIEEIRVRLQKAEQDFIQIQSHWKNNLSKMGQPSQMTQWQFSNERRAINNWDTLRAQYKATTLANVDTIPSSVDWATRGALDEEEQQRRKETRVELEATKSRFRQYLENEELRQQELALPNFAGRGSWNEGWTLEQFYAKINEDLNLVLLPQAVEELVVNWVNDQKQRSKTIEESLLENVQQVLIQQLLKGQKTVDPITSPVWQQELRTAMLEEIQFSVLEEMKITLEGPVFQLLEIDQKKFAATQTKNSLEEELRKKVQLQIQEEEKNGLNRQVPYEASANAKESEIEPEKNLNITIALTELTPGKVIKLNYLLFKPNSINFHPLANLELLRLKQFFNKHREVKVEFRAHTSTELSHLMAMDLSNQRARKIVDILTEIGVDRNQLTYRGFGKIAPLDSSGTAAAQQINQRIEMIIQQM